MADGVAAGAAADAIRDELRGFEVSAWLVEVVAGMAGGDEMEAEAVKGVAKGVAKEGAKEVGQLVPPE